MEYKKTVNIKRLIITGYNFIIKILLEIAPIRLMLTPTNVVNIKRTLKNDDLAGFSTIKRKKNIKAIVIAIYLGEK